MYKGEYRTIDMMCVIDKITFDLTYFTIEKNMVQIAVCLV